MSAIDLKQLAAEISVQHGIRVDADDPMMAVVTLNRLVLEAAVAEIVENLQSATRNLQDAAEKVQLRAGAGLAKDIRECVVAIQDELRAGALFSGKNAAPVADDSKPWRRQQRLRHLIGASLIFLSGVGIGLSLRTF